MRIVLVKISAPSRISDNITVAINHTSSLNFNLE